MSNDPLPARDPAIADYEIIRLIGEGSSGVVFKARHLATDEVVAIKFLPPHLTGNPVFRKRFEHEFLAARKIDHPNIVRALAFGESGEPFLVMEYIEGESLGEKLERDGPLAEEDAIRLIVQVCAGLDEAHRQGLVHRDIKPDNILVTAEGRVKVADLGLVKGADAAQDLTRPGSGLGTPHFMAPEQFRDAKHATVRCDVYSVGATLYQMVVGRLPFESTGPLDAWMKKSQNQLVPPRQLVPTLSPQIDEIIRRAMSADPEQRPTSCGELAKELTQARIPSDDVQEPLPDAPSRAASLLKPTPHRSFAVGDYLRIICWVVIAASIALVLGRLLWR